MNTFLIARGIYWPYRCRKGGGNLRLAVEKKITRHPGHNTAACTFSHVQCTILCYNRKFANRQTPWPQRRRPTHTHARTKDTCRMYAERWWTSQTHARTYVIIDGRTRHAEIGDGQRSFFPVNSRLRFAARRLECSRSSVDRARMYIGIRAADRGSSVVIVCPSLAVRCRRRSRRSADRDCQTGEICGFFFLSIGFRTNSISCRYLRTVHTSSVHSHSPACV